MVGTLSSISQLFTLLTAMLGGGALLAGARATRSSGAPRSRLASWLSVGAFVALAGSLLGNWLQYAQARDERQARLESTLLRPSRVPGIPSLDPTLKELSYSQQLTHKQGISTDDAAKIIDGLTRGDLKDTLLIDVRETAEAAMGTLPGATIARYPDFDRAGLDFKGKKAVLFCHNGDRSHETCEVLAARGIDCKFIVGGLEKWVVESRSLIGTSARTLDTLRAIPPYRAQRVLLDTKQVEDLRDTQGAVFVDVRYAPEFKAGHLPGAINLPIRRLPRLELAKEMESLPKKPIILPCYDRRGCFFAEVLGYELDKAGADVRGRYTLPWEYFPPSRRPPHVEAWAEEMQKGWWEKLVGLTTAMFIYLAATFGLVGAIAVAAAVSRLAVLPFSLKTERDQLVSTAIKGQIADLKLRLGSDPVRLSRAMNSLYRQHGLTPLRNLVALLFLPVMALFSMAVQKAADANPAAWLWVDHLGNRDPLFVWPILAAALLTVYLHASFVRTSRHALGVWLLAFPVLAGSLALLGAAVNVYISISAVLLLVQRVVVTGAAGRAISKVWSILQLGFARRYAEGVIPLTAGEQLAGCGNKAYRLGQLMAGGIAVPNGIVLSGNFLDELKSRPEKWRARQLKKVWNGVGATHVAVRSSASAEDGAAHSFAGVFESILEVKRGELANAVDKVAASFTSGRAKSYGSDAGTGNILVQRMVPAVYSGVLFTQDPAAAGMMLVELVEGTADGLVSGLKTPRAFRFGRLSSRPADASQGEPPVELLPLLAIGRKAEEMFAAPQDIEWAFADGTFQIVQSRNIVPSPTTTDAGALHSEWARVVDLVAGRPIDDVALVQNELTELIPRPTPLSLSLMDGFWCSGGSLDLACSRLGLTYKVEENAPGYVASVLGHLYVDRREAQARGPEISRFAVRRLLRASQTVESHFREQFLPPFLTDIRLAAATDFDRLSTPDLLRTLERRRSNFIEVTHVEVNIVNVLAQLYVDDARAALEQSGSGSIADLVPREANEPQRVLLSAGSLAGDTRLAHLVEGMGHRAVLDYEIAQPRYAEVPQELDRVAPVSAGHELAAKAVDPKLQEPGSKLAAAVQRACRFQILKEDAKHHSLRELALLRTVVLAVDRRFKLNGLAFYLTFPELARLDTPAQEGLKQLAGERKRHQQVFASTPSLTSSLTPALIEAASAGIERQDGVEGQLKGTRVSGTRAVEGRARVLSSEAAEAGLPIEDFRAGDIIVARMIHPSWLPYLRDAGGLACEIGGWLSHTALVAREYDLPMIVSVRGYASIPDGAAITLQLDGRIDVVETALLQAAQ